MTGGGGTTGGRPDAAAWAYWRRLLVCPACRGDLGEEADALTCATCRLSYPVVDGVPWMVAERARPWAERR